MKIRNSILLLSAALIILLTVLCLVGRKGSDVNGIEATILLTSEKRDQVQIANLNSLADSFKVVIVLLIDSADADKKSDK